MAVAAPEHIEMQTSGLWHGHPESDVLRTGLENGYFTKSSGDSHAC